MPAKLEIEINVFEIVKATESTTLLRLSGRWNDRVASDPAELSLVAVRRGRRTPLEQLPGASSSPASGSFAAAYAAPVDLISGRRLRFLLEAPGSRRLKLPDPTERGSARPAAAAPDRTDTAGEALREELRRLAVERGDQLDRFDSVQADRNELDRELAEVRSAAIENHRTHERANRALAEELERAKAQIEALTPVAESRDLVVRKAERRLVLLRARVEEERSARIQAEEAARRGVSELTTEVGAATAHAGRESDRNADLRRQLDQKSAEVMDLRGGAARYEPLVAGLRSALDHVGRELTGLERDAATARDIAADLARGEGDSPSLVAFREEVARQAAGLLELERDALYLHELMQSRELETIGAAGRTAPARRWRRFLST